MLLSARAIAVTSIVVALTATGGGVATMAGGAGSAAGSGGHLKIVSDIWGYAVARHPSTANYTPASKDRKNSAGTTNTVNRFGVGEYHVYLPDLDVGGLNAGTALVTPLSANGNHLCITADFGWHSPDPAEIDVQCFDRSGTLADSAFSATLIDGQSLAGASGYVWANDPSIHSYTPDTAYQYNSTGATNTIHRLSAGNYAIHLPGLATAHGNVQVSNSFIDGATTPAVCHAKSWGPVASDLVVNVQCRNVAGAAADAAFFVFFARGQGMEGPGTGPVAYLDANRPSAASYTPEAARSFSSAGLAPHIQRLGLGRYVVKLPGMPTGGAVQVTPYGTGSSRCVLSSTTTSGTQQQIGVRCFKPNGDRVDSEFGLSYQR